jgi:hypothetical protein
VQASVVLVLV